MTQTSEQALEGSPASIITMEAEVHIVPTIEMPWADGTREFPQHAAYDGYLASFLSRMETLTAYGCQGVQFGKRSYVDLSEGYLRLEANVRIDITASDAEAYANAIEWEATYPESDEVEPGRDHEEAEGRLGLSLMKVLEKRATDSGYPVNVRLSALYGRANPHVSW
ncbi:hypothetical protein GCM10023063_18740 [Arthrobacter methylotrophus]|uniref:Uncharacterized protein n=1 Tax=Arthrobacter methylotrophus TaxID=121291 RepID=A0ABV5UP46_9MICC